MAYIGQGLEYGRPEKFVFTASGSETSVTTGDDGRTIAYSIGYVDVYLNGVRLIAGTDFTATTGTSITGLAALAASDVVEVVAHNISSIADSVSKARGGTFEKTVTFNGASTVVNGGTLSVTANTVFSGNTVTINGDLTVTGTTTTISSATAQTIDLGDNDKMRFGTGNDLEIYHDGTNSRINDAGTGNLQLQLGGTTKLEVTSSGATVTGTLDMTTLSIGATSVTSTAAELNILDGVTATAAELNILDGVTATAAELNVLDGIPGTLTATELGYVDGVTSAIQTQIDAKAPTASPTFTGTTTAATLYVTNQAYGRVITAVDGATITPNFANGNHFSVTLGGNRTLASPTNAQPGQVGSIFVKQDGTGSRTLSFGANWHFPAASAPTLTTTANAVDRIDYVVYAANAVHAIATLDNRNS